MGRPVNRNTLQIAEHYTEQECKHGGSSQRQLEEERPAGMTVGLHTCGAPSLGQAPGRGWESK